MPLALSTGHEVGLAVTAAAFIVFALASAFLFPRFWQDYPGRALLAFIVISLVFFFGMLSAVEVFGAEGGEEHAAAAAFDEGRIGHALAALVKGRLGSCNRASGGGDNITILT